jgi:hypothetical protein
MLSGGPDGEGVEGVGAQVAEITLTDLDGDAVELERLHRGRANAENRVRAAKQTGLDNLPFREFDLNAAGLELSPIAQDLGAGTQALCLDGEPATREPKTLRYRLLHTAGRLAFTPAAPPRASKPRGPGPVSSPPPSPACRRSHHRPPNPWPPPRGASPAGAQRAMALSRQRRSQRHVGSPRPARPSSASRRPRAHRAFAHRASEPRPHSRPLHDRN